MDTALEQARTRAFEKNLLALGKRYPGLAGRLRETTEEISDRIVRRGPNDESPNLLYHDREWSALCYGGDDPLTYSRRYIQALDLQHAPLLVFLGFGLGYQVVTALTELSERLDLQRCIVVEKDISVFKAALRNFDFSQAIMHPAVHFLVGYSPQELFFEFTNYAVKDPSVLEYVRSLKVVIMPTVQRAEGRYYGDAYRSFKAALTHVFHDVGNDPYDALLGVRHTLANILPLIQDPGIAAFTGCFRGKPGIVIGAGPSLNKNIHLLREAGDKAVLIAVDAALKPLLNAGIRPHLVTNIERTPGQDAFFLQLERQEETFFVFSPVVPPETYAAFRGPKIIAHRYEELMDWLDIPKGSLTGGPLVGNFAFDIAQYLGCSPIIMVGQDLSFKPTGATHVQGNVYGHIDDYKKEALEVEGNYAETLLTTKSFEEGRRSLEAQIANFSGLCINATEGGAKIGGTVFLSLREALDRYCRETFDPLADLKRVWTAEKGRQPDRDEEVRRTDMIIAASRADLERAIGDCRQGLALIDAVLEKPQLLAEGKPVPHILRTIKGLTKQLNELRAGIILSPSFAPFKMIIQGYHIDWEMRRNMTRDQFHHPEFAELKSFLLLREWFATVGQLILSTRYAVTTEKMQCMQAI